MAGTVQSFHVGHVISSSSRSSGTALTLFILEVKKLRLRKMKNLLRVLQSDKADFKLSPVFLVKSHCGFLVFVLGVNSSLSHPHPHFMTVG